MKNKIFEERQEYIKEQVNKEEERLLDKIGEIEAIWSKKKPFSHELAPKDAIKVLNDLKAIIDENSNKLQNLNEAKRLLKLSEIDLDLINSITEDSVQLRVLWEDIHSV